MGPVSLAVHLCNEREQLVPEPTARGPRRSRVLEIGHAVPPRVSQHIRLWVWQHRPPDEHARHNGGFRYACHVEHGGALHHVGHDVLLQVAHVVPEKDSRCAVRRHRLTVRVKPDPPALPLVLVAWCDATRDLEHRSDLQRHAARLAPAPEVGCLGGALGAVGVVDVHSAHGTAMPVPQAEKDVCQNHRVHAARERDQQRTGRRTARRQAHAQSSAVFCARDSDHVGGGAVPGAPAGALRGLLTL
mmetsp:Transcript_16131/g.51474  ORF Transcript_16131/g.51474 Transcript_16131/m.51474 type:complete len:245 (+) Transcript_16131:1104-1838(+)